MTDQRNTERCWVPRTDPKAIEERFRIVEQADPAGAAHLVVDFLNKE